LSSRFGYMKVRSLVSQVLLKIFGKWPMAAAYLPLAANLRVSFFCLALSALTASAQTQPQLSVIGVGQELRLSITGDPVTSYRVEASSDLHHWYPMATTIPSTGVFPAATNFEVSDQEFIFGGQKFYRAVPADAPLSATNSRPDIVVSDSWLTFYEGQSATCTVHLASAPSNTVAVQIYRTSGSTNITITSGASLLFGPTNWNIPQNVTVSASHDSDFQDTLATLTVASSNLAPALVRVRAVDSNVDDEFVGPFPSWKDLKRDFGAKGDGITNDTAALQNALNTLQPNSTNHVLYIPAGTYRITKTLDFSRISPNLVPAIMFIGEDPALTTILWDGATNGVMLIYGAWYSKMSRLTFDGAGKAKTAIAHDAPFSTHNEFSDMVFKDLSFGIEAGTPEGGGNAETAVERCLFQRCALAGISIQNPNSLDWFIWNSEFDDCGVGVCNTYGAGNFQVYESLFRRSTQADMSIGNTGYFSARNDTSIGSAAFFTSIPLASCGLITLQGNTVVQPTRVPLQLGDYGPVVLLDNWIGDYQGLVGNIEPSSAFFSMGNTFTVTNAIPGGFNGPGGIRLNDVVTNQRIPMLLPKLPGALPHSQRQIFDLPGPTNAAGIQAVINQAVASGSTRPVVHLPTGDYSIEQTITIPAGTDLQLIGDGDTTGLHWAGTGQGPMVHLAGPVRATLRDFYVFGPATNSLVDGIVIDNCDQPGGKVYFDQLDVSRSSKIGLLAQGLTNASTILSDFYHQDNQVSLRAVGGSAVSDYNPGAGQVSVFGGGSAANGVTYDVSNGGKLLVRDVWYEAGGTNSSPRFMVCTNSGWFTLNGAQTAVSQSTANIPVIEVSNFFGRITLLTTQFTFTKSTLSVDGNGTNTAVLLLATLDNTEPQFNAPQAQTSLLQSFETSDYQNYNPFIDTGSTDADFLKQMLGQTRSSRPRLLAPTPRGLTDVRFHRVFVGNARIGVGLSQ